MYTVAVSDWKAILANLYLRRPLSNFSSWLWQVSSIPWVLLALHHASTLDTAVVLDSFLNLLMKIRCHCYDSGYRWLLDLRRALLSASSAVTLVFYKWLPFSMTTSHMTTYFFTRVKVLHVDGASHFHTSSVLKSLVIPTISFAMAVDIRDVFMYQGAPVNQFKMNAFLESVVEIMNAVYNCDVFL